MNLIAGFDANDVEPQEEFELLPEGQYKAIIAECNDKDTKDGTGKLIEVKLQIIEDPGKGRIFFDRLNIINANETAVQIAKQTLAAICRAVGVMNPQANSDLCNIPFVLTLKHEKRKDNGELINRPKKYEPLSKQNQAPQQPQQPQNQKPAWMQ